MTGQEIIKLIDEQLPEDPAARLAALIVLKDELEKRIYALICGYCDELFIPDTSYDGNPRCSHCHGL